MADITSPTNNRVKHIKRLLIDRRFRLREKQFVAEGSRWIDEIQRAGVTPVFWLATQSWIDTNHDLYRRLSADFEPPLTIEPNILKDLADTSTPPGVLAVLQQPQLTWVKKPHFLLLLDQIRDPGNLGTLMRSALAAGVDGLLLSPGCVDRFNPKVVRSSMGAVLRLPIRQVNWEDSKSLPPLLGNCNIYLADAAGQTPYTAVDWQQPAAIMIGGEAAGADEVAKSIVHQTISIPMIQASESLNAGVAGSVILFEALRQKTDQLTS